MVRGNPGSREIRNPDWHVRSLTFYHRIVDAIAELKYPGARAYMVAVDDAHMRFYRQYGWDDSPYIVMVTQVRRKASMVPKKSLIVRTHLLPGPEGWADSFEWNMMIRHQHLKGLDHRTMLRVSTHEARHTGRWRTEWQRPDQQQWAGEDAALEYILTWLIDSIYIPGPE